ncbi:MAG: Cys-tRNA(Pro) deacylase [Spirochaetales bacterium]|nr:Cys-tRNA(Pro) deacylase [Spirochaetales bacterium]
MGKTNAVRLLESRGIDFELTEYEVDENNLSAVSIAKKAGLNIDNVFKTLVLRSDSGEIFVCAIPGAYELNLKKAAKEAGYKKVALIHVKEILQLTGYIRGGCSPVGMKKNYPVYIDETCMMHDSIFVSAGKRGLQIKIAPEDLVEVVSAEVVDLV